MAVAAPVKQNMSWVAYVVDELDVHHRAKLQSMGEWVAAGVWRRSETE